MAFGYFLMSNSGMWTAGHLFIDLEERFAASVFLIFLVIMISDRESHTYIGKVMPVSPFT